MYQAHGHWNQLFPRFTCYFIRGLIADFMWSSQTGLSRRVGRSAAMVLKGPNTGRVSSPFSECCSSQSGLDRALGFGSEQNLRQEDGARITMTRPKAASWKFSAIVRTLFIHSLQVQMCNIWKSTVFKIYPVPFPFASCLRFLLMALSYHIIYQMKEERSRTVTGQRLCSLFKVHRTPW